MKKKYPIKILGGLILGSIYPDIPPPVATPLIIYCDIRGGYRERVRYGNRIQIAERNTEKLTLRNYLLRKREPRFRIGNMGLEKPH